MELGGSCVEEPIRKEKANREARFLVPCPLWLLCKLPPLCIRVGLGHFAFGEHPRILEASEWWWDMASNFFAAFNKQTKAG